MKRPTFDELFAFLLATPPSGADLARLRAWISSIHDPAECLALIEAAAAGRPCPHCGCARLHRCGFASGLQRFRCLGCRRTCNALTGTPLARLRKRERWLPFLQCLLESRTVRDAARVRSISSKGQEDLNAAWAWLQRHEGDERYADVAQNLLYRSSYARPQEVARILPRIADQAVQAGAATRLAQLWQRRDAAGYEAWLASLPDGPLKTAALGGR